MTPEPVIAPRRALQCQRRMRIDTGRSQTYVEPKR